MYKNRHSRGDRDMRVSGGIAGLLTRQRVLHKSFGKAVTIKR